VLQGQHNIENIIEHTKNKFVFEMSNLYKQKVNTPKLANMSIVEIDAYLRNSQQKVDNASNSKKSASQALATIKLLSNLLIK
jgi:hypothetical protein